MFFFEVCVLSNWVNCLRLFLFSGMFLLKFISIWNIFWKFGLRFCRVQQICCELMMIIFSCSGIIWGVREIVVRWLSLVSGDFIFNWCDCRVCLSVFQMNGLLSIFFVFRIRKLLLVWCSVFGCNCWQLVQSVFWFELYLMWLNRLLQVGCDLNIIGVLLVVWWMMVWFGVYCLISFCLCWVLVWLLLISWLIMVFSRFSCIVCRQVQMFGLLLYFFIRGVSRGCRVRVMVFLLSLCNWLFDLCFYCGRFVSFLLRYFSRVVIFLWKCLCLVLGNWVNLVLSRVLLFFIGVKVMLVLLWYSVMFFFRVCCFIEFRVWLQCWLKVWLMVFFFCWQVGCLKIVGKVDIRLLIRWLMLVLNLVVLFGGSLII